MDIEKIAYLHSNEVHLQLPILYLAEELDGFVAEVGLSVVIRC